MSADASSPAAQPIRHWWAVAAIALAMWGALTLEGRRAWCVCKTPTAFVADAYSSHTSQHLLDPYSFTHVEHGLIFFMALAWLAPSLSGGGRLVVAACGEAAWEVVENSSWVIDRYREATAALGYEGDSVVNSLGDLGACLVGYEIARRVGTGTSIALLVVIELVLLITIRDNLLLNVVMLLAPIEAIKDWQTGGTK